MLDALARELHGLGLHGAHYFVRRHRFDHITAALSEVLVCLERGERIANPAGMLVWLVAQAEQLAGDEEGAPGA